MSDPSTQIRLGEIVRIGGTELQPWWQKDPELLKAYDLLVDGFCHPIRVSTLAVRDGKIFINGREVP